MRDKIPKNNLNSFLGTFLGVVDIRMTRGARHPLSGKMQDVPGWEVLQG